ncbi:HPr kinase/phosphorylase [Pseudooctadecabacter jejudonensis]|uniref:HPr kinase/phosphorylase n=1 Tax=Pseudooctadecabacter jejudonensis TaxID=1391910 RepID=A0A1Y5RZB0_9RHOB|nr:serine/threonine protein kinase [Pseudooctadecabacter jejudonensis]SLN29136.1 HPr kinase/phosphorylase [Pseudooctadecabacter jejudonensis]
MLSIPVKPAPDGHQSLHASTVALNDQALVICGPSGCGKSSLALRLMSLGAALIADDRTLFTVVKGQLLASAPPTLPAGIEVRGLGLLAAPLGPATKVTAILDLGVEEPDRLPAAKHIHLLGQNVTLLHKPDTPYIAEAMVHYLMHGRTH